MESLTKLLTKMLTKVYTKNALQNGVFQTSKFVSTGTQSLRHDLPFQGLNRAHMNFQSAHWKFHSAHENVHDMVWSGFTWFVFAGSVPLTSLLEFSDLQLAVGTREKETG